MQSRSKMFIQVVMSIAYIRETWDELVVNLSFDHVRSLKSIDCFFRLPLFKYPHKLFFWFGDPNLVNDALWMTFPDDLFICWCFHELTWQIEGLNRQCAKVSSIGRGNIDGVCSLYTSLFCRNMISTWMCIDNDHRGWYRYICCLCVPVLVHALPGVNCIRSSNYPWLKMMKSSDHSW